MLSLLIGLFCLIVFVHFIRDCLKPTNFPPGPTWLPLIGCLPTFCRLRKIHGYNYRAFQKLGQMYGPVLGLKLGNQKLVVISTHDLVKQVLLQNEFNGRPDGFFFRVRSFGKRKGILFTEGTTWSQCRKFTLRHLRNFGLGQSFMKSQLTIEARDLVDNLYRLGKLGPVPMHNAFDIAVLNSLWTMFSGKRFNYANKKLDEILQAVHEGFRLMDTMGGIVSQMPFLRFIVPELCGYNKLMRILVKLWAFLDEEITFHENTLSNDDEPRDLIEAFLREIALQKNDESSESIFDRENLLVLCLDLFLAGSKTTTDTLATIFLYLSLHTEWVKILQEELKNVIGRSRPPTLEDAPSLPMVEAFLAEIQRFLILAPLGVPHRTMKEVSFNGYQIPKDTVVLLDFHSVHNDRKYWERPDEFRPQRFLNDKGQFSPHKGAMPFGVGKRRCLGEMLARSSSFLFFTYVIHYFDFEIAPECGIPDLNGYDGFVISPKPYCLKLSIRNDIEDIDFLKP